MVMGRLDSDRWMRLFISGLTAAGMQDERTAWSGRRVWFDRVDGGRWMPDDRIHDLFVHVFVMPMTGWSSASGRFVMMPVMSKTVTAPPAWGNSYLQALAESEGPDDRGVGMVRLQERTLLMHKEGIWGEELAFAEREGASLFGELLGKGTGLDVPLDDPATTAALATDPWSDVSGFVGMWHGLVGSDIPVVRRLTHEDDTVATDPVALGPTAPVVPADDGRPFIMDDDGDKAMLRVVAPGRVSGAAIKGHDWITERMRDRTRAIVSMEDPSLVHEGAAVRFTFDMVFGPHIDEDVRYSRALPMRALLQVDMLSRPCPAGVIIGEPMMNRGGYVPQNDA